MRSDFFLAIVVLAGGFLMGCDKKSSSPATGRAAPQNPSPTPATPGSSPPAVLATKADPIADFKTLAASVVDALWNQVGGKVPPNTTFESHLYERETTLIDVRRTDSLLNPIVGSVAIKKTFGFGKYDAEGKCVAAGIGQATDTLNFSFDGSDWRYINGRSIGTLIKQDVRNVSLYNREGTSSAVVDEDLSNSPRIVAAVQAARATIKRSSTSAPVNRP